MFTEDKSNIKIGEFRVIKKPYDMVWTILGSCVAIIFHIKDNFSMFSHAQHPAPKDYGMKCSDTCPHPCFLKLQDSNRFKYVTCSIEYMVNLVNRKKIDIRKVRISLIGGATMLTKKDGSESAGKRNILAAKEILQKNGLRVHREITGGEEGYTLWYNAKNNKLRYRYHKSEEVFEV